MSEWERESGGKPAPKTRSVLKANYFPAKGTLPKATASLRYYASRANETGDKQDRDVFTRTEDQIPVQEVTQQLKTLMQEGDFDLGYRMILSPNAAKDASAASLREWTRELLATVERHHKVHWFAVAHTEQNAHTAHAHVHVIAALKGRLSKEELATLRRHGDAHWQDIVRRQQLLEQLPKRRVHERQPQREAALTQLPATRQLGRSAGLEL